MSSRLAGMKKPKSVPSPPTGPMDVFCMHWMGIPAAHAMRIVVLGVAGGAVMEAFMIKVWIGQTNFYEVVKKKEAEKRLAARTEQAGEEPSFGVVVRQQWEERKREMELQKKDS